MSPRRVFGVDFSASEDAGRHIWICRAHPGDDGIRIESVDRLEDLPGGAADRGAALAALVQRVAESPRSAWGFDFSFSLPEKVFTALAPALSGYDKRLDLVAAFGGPEAMRQRCGNVSGGTELRRRTDSEAATPFSPCDVRVYKQTYYGITGVLRPLHARPETAVLPFDALPESEAGAADRLPFNRAASGPAPHVYLMEVCPRSVLVGLGYPSAGYGGSGDDAAAKRRSILRRLVDDDLVRPVARAPRQRIIDAVDGDALDAVLAAVGAWRGYRHYDHAALRAQRAYAVEGFVYT